MVKNLLLNNIKIKCKDCDNEAETRKALIGHRNYRNSVRTAIECNTCDFKASSLSEKRRHDYHTHRAEKTYRCSLCPGSKEFKSNQNLNIHTNKKHLRKYEWIEL